MAIPVSRVHLAMAHAALPALLPTPPKWNMLPLLPTPCPCAAAILRPKPLAKKPSSRADSDERWDARKTQPASAEPSSSSSSSSLSSSGPQSAHGVRSKNATSPQTKPGRADSVDRWNAHKKAAASPASSSSSPSSSSGSETSSLVSSSKWAISRASSDERWDVHKHKKRCPSQAELLDDGDGESSSTGSNDINVEEEEEEILWKPRAIYAGPGFVVAAPEPSMLPMPTTFLVRVA